MLNVWGELLNQPEQRVCDPEPVHSFPSLHNDCYSDDDLFFWGGGVGWGGGLHPM